MADWGPRVRVGVVLVEDDSVLMVEQGKGHIGYWLLPGGGLERGETLEAAAAREVDEELGMRIEVVRWLYLVEVLAPDGRRHALNVVCLGRRLGNEAPVPRDPAIRRAAWVPISELTPMDLRPPLADKLQESHAKGWDHPMEMLGPRWGGN